jgi:hypothetical protein
MNLNLIKIHIESQKKWHSNYIKNNAIRYCNEVIKYNNLDRVKKRQVQNLLLKIEAVQEPWNRNGIPNSKESLVIIAFLEELVDILT